MSAVFWAADWYVGDTKPFRWEIDDCELSLAELSDRLEDADCYFTMVERASGDVIVDEGECTIAGNIITYEQDAAAMARSGTFDGQLRFVFADGKVVHQVFTFQIKRKLR